MAIGAKTYVAYTKEVTFDTLPTTPTFQKLRTTGDTLGLSKETLESGELRSDRMIADVRHGNKQVGGEINIELSYDTFDAFFPALLYGSWIEGARSTGLTVTVAASAKTFTRTAGSFVTDGFKVGDVIETKGFAASGNNGTFTVTTIATLVLTCSAATGLVDVSDDTPVEIATTKREYVKAGKTSSARASSGAITGSTDTVTDKISRASGSFVTDGFVAGESVTVAGFSNESNNGVFFLTAVSATELTVDTSLTDEETSVSGVTVTSKKQTVATNNSLTTFCIEKGYTDIAKYLIFKGVGVNSLSLSVTPNAMITGSFGLVGGDMDDPYDASQADTMTDAPTYSPFDSFTGSMKENDTSISIVTSIAMAVEQGLNPKFGLFSDSAHKLSYGRIRPSGTISLFFEDTTYLEKFIDETESSVEFTLIDLSGNSIRVTVPKIKYNNGDLPTNTEDDLILGLPFLGLYDSDSDTSVMIEKIDA